MRRMSKKLRETFSELVGHLNHCYYLLDDGLCVDQSFRFLGKVSALAYLTEEQKQILLKDADYFRKINSGQLSESEIRELRKTKSEEYDSTSPEEFDHVRYDRLWNTLLPSLYSS